MANNSYIGSMLAVKEAAGGGQKYGWEGFQENLKSLGEQLGTLAMEQRKRKQDMEDAFNTVMIKSKAEQMARQGDPMYKIFQGVAERMAGGKGTPPTNGETEDTEQIMGTGEDYQFKPSFTFGEGGKMSMSVSSELSPEAQLRGKIKETKEIKRAQLTEEINVKREQYKNDLNNFLAIDDVLHQSRGEGFGRFKAGSEMVLKGIGQKGKLGQAVGAYDAVSKRLRVQLVRAAGDVGNINIVEQEAAEKLIPSKFDSKQTADIKRAYLIEISKAIDSGEESLVKQTLDKIGVGYTEIKKEQSSKEDFSYLWE